MKLGVINIHTLYLGSIMFYFVNKCNLDGKRSEFNKTNQWSML